METSREQDVWSEQNAWERDSARSASFNAHYRTGVEVSLLPNQSLGTRGSVHRHVVVPKCVEQGVACGTRGM